MDFWVNLTLMDNERCEYGSVENGPGLINPFLLWIRI